MNAKAKIRAGRRAKIKRGKVSRFGSVPFNAVVRQARAAIRGAGITAKSVGNDKRKLRLATLTALKAVRRFRKGKRFARLGRVLPLPKSGGFLPFLPIFAGLSAIGSVAGGAAGIAKAVTEARDAKRRLIELQRHNKSMEDIALHSGKGLFLKPYPKGGLGLYMKPYVRLAKNC